MMEIIIKGDAKEIAALVLELQERQKPKFVPCDAETGGKDYINQKCCC